GPTGTCENVFYPGWVGEGEWTGCIGRGWRRWARQETSDVGEGGILLPRAEAGKQQAGAGRRETAQVGEGRHRSGEEHHAVARDEEVGREIARRTPDGGVGHLERKGGVMVAGPLARGIHELRRDIHADHAAARMEPRNRQRQLAGAAADVERRVERALLYALQEPFGQHAEAAIGTAPLRRPAIAGAPGPFVGPDGDGRALHTFSFARRLSALSLRQSRANAKKPARAHQAAAPAPVPQSSRVSAE